MKITAKELRQIIKEEMSDEELRKASASGDDHLRELLHHLNKLKADLFAGADPLARRLDEVSRLMGDDVKLGTEYWRRLVTFRDFLDGQIRRIVVRDRGIRRAHDHFRAANARAGLREGKAMPDIPSILAKARLAFKRQVKVEGDVVGIKFSKSPQMNRSKHFARKGKVVSALKDAGFDNAKSLNKSDSDGYWQFQV